MPRSKLYESRRRIRNVNPTIERLQAGTNAEGGEVMDWTYYDTLTMLNTTLTHHLFTASLGGATGKTEADTNMRRDGAIPQGQRLTAKFIKIFYTAMTAKSETAYLNLLQMIEKTTLKIKIEGKDSMGTFKLIEVFGTPLNLQIIPSVAGDNIPILNANFKGVLTLNKPLIFAALTTFEVEITHHVAPADTLNADRLTVGLSGRLERLA